MSTRGLMAVFCAVFFVLLLAWMPLSVLVPALALDARGFSHGRVEGSVWQGRIAGLAWRGRYIGDARLSVSPLGLVLGRLTVDVALGGAPGIKGAGRVIIWPNASVAVEDFALTSDVAMLPVVLPLTGSVTLDIHRAEFTRGGCRAVEADVQTNALVDRPAGLAWQGPVLSGRAMCRAGVLVVPLAGGAGAESVAVAVQLVPDGTFTIQVDARTADETVKGILSAVGFTAVGEIMTLTQNGRWS
jgi:hypothetical protein